jgi:hypothetical protein
MRDSPELETAYRVLHRTDYRIMLKSILKEYDMMLWTGFIHHRIESNGLDQPMNRDWSPESARDCSLFLYIRTVSGV